MIEMFHQPAANRKQVMIPLRDTNGRSCRIAGFADDVTTRRRTEERLRQAQKMEAVGQRAASVAHDFANILAAIMVQLDLLEIEADRPDKTRQGLAKVRDCVERASTLTKQLLLFSRLETMQASQFDWNDRIRKMSTLLDRVVGDGVRVTLRPHRGAIPVSADATMLDRLLINLVVNARDAMPNGGRLVVAMGIQPASGPCSSTTSATTSGPYGRLSVRDAGCGISDENLSHVFDPFFTTKPVGQGTGLGLATVMEIVKRHNGWVELRSKVGHGTTIDVYLPLSSSATASDQRSPGKSRWPPSR